jgi:hypothetical protein
MSPRPKRRLSTAMIATGVGAALMLAVAGGFLWADATRAKLHADDDAAAYAASGPPCPAVTSEQLQVNGPHLRHDFGYGDMVLSYAFGGADCAWIKGREGRQAVCKFDGPGSLGVRLKGAQRLFTPGIGKSAAIIRRGDRLSCVMIPRIE